MGAPKYEYSTWTVYKHPKDWPHHYVARRWVLTTGEPKPTDTVLVSRTLIKLRRALERRMGLTFVPRDPSDEPQIVGVWL